MLKHTYTTVASLFFICNLFVSASLSAQSEKVVTWEMLSDVKFVAEWDEQLQTHVNRPVFGEEVEALDGQEIIIKGYLLPEKGYKTHKEFTLSALPYNLCYFCGKAGPETVMEVTAEDPVRYSNDPIVLKGRLMLNRIEPFGLPYILWDAQLVKQ